MIPEESFDTDKLIEFLAALIKDSYRLDNLWVHH